MRVPLIVAMLALTACSPQHATGPDESATTHAFNGIGADETVHFTGTEPFWGGEAKDGKLTYTTPENQAGATFAVQRFAGNSGLGFSGTLEGRSFDMAVTRGQCSDGMSDRTYPFTATVRIGEDQRNGCAWTDSHPFSGPEKP
jgi:uncharacterized membrane protein